jgi:hypothetical protein
MESLNTRARETTDLHHSSHAGFRDARMIGNELTRQGRLRMDASQTERRLQSAYSALGETVFKDLSELRSVNLNDGRIIELLAHIRYYQDELARLRKEMTSEIEAS